MNCYNFVLSINNWCEKVSYIVGLNRRRQYKEKLDYLHYLWAKLIIKKTEIEEVFDNSETWRQNDIP